MVDGMNTLKSKIIKRINDAPLGTVWTAVDFLDLGTRVAIYKTLQRLVANHELRRIDHGLYDKPQINLLTKLPTVPDYRKVIDAVARRDQVRILIDGMTCANELGLTNAVPGKVIIHTDGRLSPIKLGNLIIKFKLTTPSKLYWAGRPGMRIIQALYWLHDVLQSISKIEQDEVKTKLMRFLHTSQQSKNIRNDLRQGLHTVPVWMQDWIKDILSDSE